MTPARDATPDNAANTGASATGSAAAAGSGGNTGGAGAAAGAGPVGRGPFERLEPRRIRTDRDLEQDIPYGVRIAAAWAWRLGLILLITGALVWLLAKVSFLIIPVMVAALLAGLLSPVVRWLRESQVPNGAAVAITVLAFIGLIAGSLALVGRQLALGFQELWSEALTGIQQIQDWLAQGPCT